jgi:hypothetical protein
LILRTVLAIALCQIGATARANPSSARYVCKDFIARSGYNVQDWGEWSAWTAIDNRDGSWSVGARFMGAAPGGFVRNLYVTCVMRKSGDDWRLVKLTRLQ